MLVTITAEELLKTLKSFFYTRNSHENDFVKLDLKTIASHVYGQGTDTKTFKSIFYTRNSYKNDLVKINLTIVACHNNGQGTFNQSTIVKMI